MKLLLGTHIILWSATEPRRLGADVRKLLEDESNELWFSPISFWETLILAEKRRIFLKPTPIGCFWKIVEALSLKEAPLTSEVAIQSRQLDLSHQDPADRFIAATAVVYGLTLVTADKRLLENKNLPIIPNT